MLSAQRQRAKKLTERLRKWQRQWKQIYTVKTETADLYADDALSESVKEFTNGTLKLGIKDLTPETLAEVLGQLVDENKVVWARWR